MIHVLATIELSPGTHGEFLGHFHQVMKLVRDEAGCLEYGPAIDVQTSIPAQGELRPNVVTVIEKWASIEHLERHLIAPHMMEYRGKVKSLVQNVTLRILEPAE